MKRFCIKTAALILILGALVWGLGWAFRQTTTYQNMEINDWTIDFHDMPEQIEIAVVGSSHGKRSVDFSPYTEKTFNFSLSGQIPVYDVRMLREYGKRMGEGALVVAIVSPTGLYYRDSESAFISKQERYYRVLSPQNIVDCDLGRWCLSRFSPILTENVNQVVNAFLSPPELAKKSNRHKTFCVEQSVIEQEIRRIKRDHVEPVFETFPEPDPVMYHAYEEMAQLCREREWRLVWVTPPYTQDYLSCLGEDFFLVFEKQMRELAEKCGVPYYNFSHDARFTDDYSLFSDIDHLNLYGQRMFTNIVMQELGLIDGNTAPGQIQPDLIHAAADTETERAR